jgi:hypothetical protein
VSARRHERRRTTGDAPHGWFSEREARSRDWSNGGGACDHAAVRATQRATLGGFVLALAACGSDVTESLTTAADASDSSTSDDPASTGASMTAASMSISDDGGSISAGSDGSDASEDTGGSGSEASSGNGEGGSDGAHAESDSGGDDDEGQDAETSAEESTGSPVDCAPLDEDACEAAGGACMSLVGAELVHENGPFWCIGDEQFAGCVTSSDCGRAETVACEDGGDGTWIFPSTCLPNGWSACEPPGNGDYDACG